MLTFEEFSKTNAARCAQIAECDWIAEGDWKARDWALAIFGETGELCNLIKKMKRGAAFDPEQPELIEDAGEELADIVTYCDLLATYWGLSLEEEVVKKFHEVNKRYSFPVDFSLHAVKATPEVVAAIAQSLVHGYSLKEACSIAHLPLHLFHEWILSKDH